MELHQPETLETLAIVKLAAWIALRANAILAPLAVLHKRRASKADTALSRTLEITRNHLESNVPNKLHDKLAVQTIRALQKLWEETKGVPATDRVRNCQANIIGRSIEVILTNNITSLSYYYDGTEIFLKSFKSKIHTLAALTDLELNVRETDTIEFLKKLHNLKNLSLNICTNGILRCIAKNCKLIEVLNLKNGRSINDTNVEYLTRLTNLRSVDLYDSAATEKGIAKLLLSCRHIEYIGTSHIERALEYIVSKRQSDRELKLKSYKNSRNVTLEQLQLVIKMSPLIEKTIFYKYTLRHTDIILALIDFEKLRDLQLVIECDFYLDQVKEMLQVRGRNLVELSLYSLREIDVDALMCIGQMCPNLQGLKMKYCHFVKETPLNLLPYQNGLLEVPPLKYLKRLSLDAWSLESQPTEEQLVFLLSNCPNIEFISTGPSVLLTDDVMLQVLDRNPLVYLKELRMAAGELTITVIDRITRNCINLPVVIISR